MLFALFVTVGGKCPTLGRRFIARGQAAPAGRMYGDLYQMSGLDRFKEPIPTLRPGPMAPLADADILTLGDSFFNSTLASDLFANELSARTSLKVHNLAGPTIAASANFPVPFLESIGYKGDRKRILILESVERSVIMRGNSYLRTASPVVQVSAKAVNNVEYFFKNNLIVHPLARLLREVRFKFFKITDKSIGAYAQHPDMLFFREDVDFAKSKKSDALLDDTAASIAKLSQTLERRFNLEVIYLVIPDKYSVYRRLDRDGDGYDRFIPRLSKKLSERAVKNIDLYTIFTERSQPGMPLLYYASDTHYTARGKELAVEACARMLANLHTGR